MKGMILKYMLDSVLYNYFFNLGYRTTIAEILLNDECDDIFNEYNNIIPKQTSYEIERELSKKYRSKLASVIKSETLTKEFIGTLAELIYLTGSTAADGYVILSAMINQEVSNNTFWVILLTTAGTLSLLKERNKSAINLVIEDFSIIKNIIFSILNADLAN